MTVIDLEQAVRIARGALVEDDGDRTGATAAIYKIADTIESALRAAAQAAQPSPPPAVAGSAEGWQDIATAPKDGTLVLLLMRGSDDAEDCGGLLEDAEIGRTVGAWMEDAHDGGGPAWSFAGWDWCHDRYVDGDGTPIGWLPLPLISAVRPKEA